MLLHICVNTYRELAELLSNTSPVDVLRTDAVTNAFSVVRNAKIKIPACREQL